MARERGAPLQDRDREPSASFGYTPGRRSVDAQGRRPRSRRRWSPARILRSAGYAGVLAAALLIPTTAHPDAQIAFSTPLHWAASNDQTRLIEMLIANGAPPSGADSWGRTPLHVGVRYHDVVELLLSSGASVNARDRFGNTPLHLAIAYRDVVELLLSKGADVGARNVFGRTPLDVCLARGDSPYNTSVAEMLVKAGAGKPGK